MLAKNLIESAGNASEPNYIESVFSTYLYTGNGTTQTINNGIDLTGKGGMTLIKRRSSDEHPTLFDTARGNNRFLYTNQTVAEYNITSLSFNSNGFTMNNRGDINYVGETYASWTFRKQPKFFDVVTYTGTGSSRTVAHSLGSVPGCIIVKRTSGVENWTVYHQSQGANKVGFLNLTNAFGTNNTIWGNTSPTSTVFTVGDADAGTNANGSTYVAYIFAHDAGGFGLTGTDNVISCGSFTTDGSGRATVELGYEPQWLMQKSTGSGRWEIEDIMRGWSRTSVAQLMPNLSNAEEITDGSYFTPTATGFTTISAGLLLPSATYIYIAIRRGPMKVPTDATKVFKPSTVARNTDITGVNFPVDMFLCRKKTESFPFYFSTRLTNAYLDPSATSAEAASTGIANAFAYNLGTPNQDSFRQNTFGDTNMITEMFQRAPSFFDVVCYTGTGAAMTVSHNLGVAPELMIVKRRDTARGWTVYSAALGATKSLQLQLTDAEVTVSTIWNDTAPTSSVFTVGTNLNSGASGGTYVNYLFATCAGVSKVGSYTGTGTTKQVDCGFAAGARFVLIKKTSGTGSWYIWDSSRGITSGNDPYLLLNSTAAEVTSTDYIDTYAAGFEISSTAPSEINENGGSFVYLAIA